MILAIIAVPIIIANFYTLSFVINYGNYPIWWDIVLIIVLMLLILGLTKLMSKKSENTWSLFFGSCCLIFILTEFYFLTMIEN